jgi:hypothetical protein
MNNLRVSDRIDDLEPSELLTKHKYPGTLERSLAREFEKAKLT